MDVATGTMFSTHVDAELRGRLPLVFRRFYSTALLQEASVLGAGWRHNYQHSMRATLEGFVYIDANGGTHAFEDNGSFDATHRLVSPGMQMELRGTRDRLELIDYGGDDPAAVMVFTRLPKSKEYRLAHIATHPNNRLDMGYDARGALTSVQQSRGGDRLALVYGPDGRIAEVVFVGERRELVARYEYSAAGDLVTVSDPRGPVAQFRYDELHLMIHEQHRSGRVYEFRYDAARRCIRASGVGGFEERTLRYDPAARTTVVTDSHGQPTTYVCNESGQVLSITNALGGTIRFAYDDLGRRITEENANGVLFVTEYDSLGHIYAVVYPDGRKLQIEWSDRHVPLRCIDLAGRVWSYEYDEHSLLLRSVNPLGSEMRYTYDAFGQIETVTNPLGNTSRYVHDAKGRFAAFVDARGHARKFERDAWGRVVAATDALGAVTRLTYDDMGFLRRVDDPDGSVWTYDYDAQERIRAERGPGGYQTDYRYNACGQITELRTGGRLQMMCEWDTEPGRIMVIRDANGNTISYDYDAVGRPLRRRGWDGKITSYEYDHAGQVTAIVGPDGGRSEYEYDPLGLLILRRSQTGLVTEWKYDDNGFPVLIKQGDDELQWERDLYGLVLAQIHRGVRVEYERDAISSVRRIKTPFAPDIEVDRTATSSIAEVRSGAHAIAFTYDAEGRELSRSFGGAQFQRRWDVMGRLLDEWYMPPGAAPDAPAAAPMPGGAPMPFRRNYRYGADGHLAFIQDSRRGNTRLFHDLRGQLQAVFRSDGRAEYYEYDDAYNRTGFASVRSASPPRIEDAFTADQSGRNLLDVNRLRATGAELTRYAIGPGNRVSTARRDRGGVSYDLDDLGYVVAKRVDPGNGEPIQQWRYRWDDEGRLAAVERPDGETWSYEYDPLTRRVRKQGPTGVTRYVWDRSKLLHEIDPDERVTTYVHHPDNGPLLMRRRGPEVEFAIPDHLDGVSELVDANGTVVWAAKTTTWGESPDDAPESGFPGQSYDRESGLYYNRHRYYDPELGRYLSPDPIGLLGGPNEYAYVPSPFEGIDPDGLAKALGGGPFDYPAGNDENGRPLLREPGGRTVTDPRQTGGSEGVYGERRVPAPGSQGNPDANGKTIAVLRGPNATSPDGAFVSGRGRGRMSASPNVPGSWDVVGGHMGNWTHAEIQALNFLHKNGTPGHYTLFIDRPPCCRCSESVGNALATLKKNGIHVDVWYMRTNAETGEVEWHRYGAGHSC